MRSLNVLILEDNAFQLMALHQMFNANQVFNVMTAHSVADARQSLANRGDVDIAICDLQMEGPDGLEMIRYLAEGQRARAIIILSSSDRSVLDGAAYLARQQGMWVLGCVQKPASALVIRELLEAYCAGRPDLEQRPLLADCAVFSLEELHPLAPGQRMDEADITEQWIAHYQPKVSIGGDLLGVEALARWQHPRHGLLSPGGFMAAVEDAGLIVPLTWRMLELALKLSSEVMQASGSALPVAVNIVPEMFNEEDFVEGVGALLARFELPANVLTLEVIERSALQTTTAQLEGLLRLRMRGCTLSIDDFGTGASNIQRLLQLPFSELKIPAEFVRGMADDARKAAVVAGAWVMAREMEMQVVVEGVETACDYEAVKALGQPSVQGYLIAKPMSETDLLSWMAARSNVGLRSAHAPANK
ncbi:MULTISPECIES: EAL domain-containing response regulator [unclassified Pseudomonas]|uniref:EAL domain-containing response regulator n=1 Tax=unclassified Pseudomonas TaxID=196821 RepID=UPI002AC9159F|nr:MULTISPECIES: EAL domain-containing response regulator [unclassified Pseudomonas]MEB0039551.1 EAL domain-containing response regulator [Pseudomonas sp. MH10]MEB0077014.1 EAL domain-containing response regulator [Pseudomonas sp. MH10out]MEB0089816.1 EAL domain-containing response regulator [Pseudomonas sp. CCI4.2]MEB0102362.1 EAL domain-containing response regulator [Pseudomonas sp. CCI3.2]MEB0120231.1 EAL domain-containing response regulator [Pseudomonas sp. CCI1.2]